MIELLLIAGGFVGLLVGGNWLVDGAVSLAQRLGISPLVIGLTLVGFGTSMPELVTSVQAALAGSDGIAVGNVIGSNIANILLILGFTAVLGPIAVARSTLRRDGAVMLLATAAAMALVVIGQIGRPAGILLIFGLILYVVWALRSDTAAPDDFVVPGWSLPRATLTLIGGLAVVILAARSLILGAVALAESFGVSEALIGVTIVAVGTSLPELMTSAIAARRGQSDIALGNIIGSNIFNLLGILGATALVHPLQVPAQFVGLDIWVMVLASLALVVMARTGLRITRREGAVLLAGYGGYSAMLVASI